MDWLWTWKGKSFGYRRGDELRLRTGEHVGNFRGNEVFDLEGRYSGEVRNGNRLIVRKSKKGKKLGSRTAKRMKLVSQVNRVNLVGLVNLSGYEDFPNPNEFNS
jgi:hypothetical protein